jgi:hypothetical protein
MEHSALTLQGLRECFHEAMRVVLESHAEKYEHQRLKAYVMASLISCHYIQYNSFSIDYRP